MYWELLSADEKGVLTLGAYSSHTGSGGTIQTANTRYYASGGYYRRNYSASALAGAGGRSSFDAGLARRHDFFRFSCVAPRDRAHRRRINHDQRYFPHSIVLSA